MTNDTESYWHMSGWSHDIRTHLNVLLSAISMLESARLPPEKVKQYLAMVKQNALAMLRLVNHLLDIRDRANCKPMIVSAQIDGLLLAIAESIRPFVEARGLELVCDISEPLHVRCDLEMLERILYNLLSNSVKFTEPGGFVYLSAHCHGDEVSIHVADTGHGMTPEQVARVCGAPSADDDVGMGLYLVKTLTAQMQGRISCTTRENIGTTFYLNLPAADPSRRVCAACDESLLRIEMSCLQPPS